MLFPAIFTSINRFHQHFTRFFPLISPAFVSGTKADGQRSLRPAGHRDPSERWHFMGKKHGKP